MYKLLIVDDEPNTLEGMKRIIDWAGYDIEIAATAQNGEEGAALATKLGVDLILTDIRMRDVDGLSMIEELSRKGFDGAVIVMSGYDTFEYAKRAMHSGVRHYLLKPISRAELRDTVEQCIEELERKRCEALYKKLDLFRDIEEELLEDTPDINESIDFPRGGMVFVQLQADRPLVRHHSDKLKIYKLFLQRADRLYISFQGPERVDVLIADSERAAVYDFGGLAGCGFKGGISNRIYDISGLKNAMWESNIAMQNAFYDENDNAILQYREDMNKSLDIYFGQLQKNLIETFEGGDAEGAAEIVENMFNTAYAERFSASDVIYWSEHILRQFIGIIREKDEELAERYSHELKSLVKGGKSISQIQEMLMTFLDECNEVFGLENVDYNTKLIQKVVAYVDEHYMEDITLKQLAAEFFVDTSYLSKLFKSFTRMRYIDYVTYKRIQKAKNLLKNPNLAIYEIANMLNYRDAKYFSNLFKKTEGITPRQYRMKN